MGAGFKQRVADQDALETRVTIASFRTYLEAEEAVDYLADNRFPVERVSIVGHGVRLVEQVTGRYGYLEAALRNGLAGAVVGALIGWLFEVFNWFNPVVASGWLILDGLWFGFVVGALMGLLQRAMLGGRRDFSSVGGFSADRWDVVADEEVAGEAVRLLEQAGVAGASTAAATGGTGRES